MSYRYSFLGSGILLTLTLASPVVLGDVPGGTNDALTSPERNEPAKSGPAISRRVELNIPAGSYFSGLEGRKLLRYLVRCALDANTEARLTLPNERLSFMGGAGLGPEWTERALTASEQRWVSACIFALTNKLGESVPVDLRGSHPMIDERTDTEQEKRTYALHEGGFFGNIFAPAPVAYVCEGADSKRMLGFPIGRIRLCAQPSNATTVDGQPISACGFIITGACGSPSSFVVNGEQFNEVIHTWLLRD